jgi:hypothetical protein
MLTGLKEEDEEGYVVICGNNVGIILVEKLNMTTAAMIR